VIVRAGTATHTRVGAGPPCPATAARAVPRAPEGPPLTSGRAEGPAFGRDASVSAPPSGGDPLVENGLGSPLCGEAGALDAAARSNCATSGFEAAGAPTGNYGLDVHIETGLFGLTFTTVLQDFVIGPVWTALVWIVHTLVVALEWCFTLDLLDSSAMAGVERSLHRTQAAFTGPWLVLVLAVASLAAAYNGLVRRRVAETLGQAALTGAMMVGGLWTIADPAGTVGALGRWADEAGAGTFGAVVSGSPAEAPRTLAQSMGGLFAGVVGAPWCYLEFGNVGWCADTGRLEPRLRAAGLAFVEHAHVAHCPAGGALESICEELEREAPAAPARGAAVRLMRAARTNGEVFLALPANEAARNSITDTDSLLSVLCGGAESLGECRGPAAAEARFRTGGGTFPRLAGLVLIAAGAAAMILLLGFIVLHLLGAEILSLVYLLLAPAAVLAPALGDGGRAAFRTWGTRLIGAVCSKLIFSFLLGVVLLLTRTLMELEAFGWWTRWLLVTVLWWGAYRERRRVLGFIAGEHRGQGARKGSLAERMKRQLDGPRAALRTAQWVRGKLAGPAPGVERRKRLERIGGERAKEKADAQTARMLEHEHGEAVERVGAASEIQGELSAKRTQLDRVNGARERATAAGDTRKAAEMGGRAKRIEGEIEHGQTGLNEARRTVAEGERAKRRAGKTYTREQAKGREKFLDAQAALPAGGRRGRGGRGGEGEARDYARLAGLAGYSREQYERLGPRERREARLEIDRELAVRRELSGAVDDAAAAGERKPGRREEKRAKEKYDRVLDGRVLDGGHAPPRSRTGGAPTGPPGSPGRPTGVPRRRGPRGEQGHDPRDRPSAGAAPRFESPLMQDAYEVQRRRKRQLGGP
jgi:hypothetical protein